MRLTMIEDYQEIQTAEVEPAEQPETRAKSGFWKASESRLPNVFKTLLLALVLYFAISAVTDRVRVENVSMQPTLYEGELLVVSKLAYQFGEPPRGDIIVFHHTTEPPA